MSNEVDRVLAAFAALKAAHQGTRLSPEVRSVIDGAAADLQTLLRLADDGTIAEPDALRILGDIMGRVDAALLAAVPTGQRVC